MVGDYFVTLSVGSMKTTKLNKTQNSQDSQTLQKKSSIREKNQLLTNADSSTDTTVGWTKNTPKPDFFCKMEKIIQNAKT